MQKKIIWPNGARCACAITFDIDADSLIHIAKPVDGHDRLYPISMGRYGPTVAIPRILETYKRLGLKQSFFAPGWVVEQYPDAMQAILKDGHEIGHHGYLHEDPTNHSASEQTYWFERALESHKRVLGNVPKGYRAPVYNVTQAVIDLLNKHEFDYDSSLMADDVPYLMRSGGRTLVELPSHWGTDDWPQFAHFEEIGYMMPVAGPRAGLTPFWEEFEAQYEEGGFWIGIWHPFLTGRLARWRQVEDWMESILNRGNVWFATLGEIAQHVRMQYKADRQSVRVEELPYYQTPVLTA
ncbi:polysaccharide deacetylase family protein [Ruegeria arenilitoris]|uniref:polysaccharide deacetylase family protein n=1 Tax=Ruegeria arenilitoris TaxID=1173585 RepID=UPI001CFD4B2E|nr:polysaccharide deacetylase [Ruegeria arenilitoris]